MTQDAPIIIRKLSSSDINLFRQMLMMFGRVFNEVGTYAAAQPQDTYVETLLSGDQFIAVVALKDGVVVGGLASYELKKFEQERSEIYIYDLAIDDEHRRKGVATRLIEHLKGIAIERGAYVIFVQADISDDPAIALYTKLGVREDVLHFDVAPP